MMYRFRSKAAGDLLMTQPVGERVLALIGKPAGAQGIIEVDQMLAAMNALQAAVAAGQPQAADDHGDDGDDDEAHASPSGPDRVGLRQRVWPMVEMMKRALAEREPIVWGG